MDTLGLIVVAGLVLYFFVSNQNLFASSISTGSGFSNVAPLLPSGNLTPAQIASVASIAGFGGADLITAVAIALAESGGNPNALGDVGIGQGSFGLWQINSLYHPEYGPNFAQLYNPQINANAAHTIYLQAGSSFSPWTTYNTRVYASFIPSVEASI